MRNTISFKALPSLCSVLTSTLLKVATIKVDNTVESLDGTLSLVDASTHHCEMLQPSIEW